MSERPIDAARRILIPAPAKLNLFLRITGRRADGYHTLQTVFQFIDLCDELELTLRTDGRISRVSALASVAECDDLCVRAARALQQASGTRLGADIRLVKRIPMGAGLGGGSSDAASVLLGLNRLWGTGMEPAALARLGLQLGADVPVFVHGVATWAEGVGERFTAIALDERDLLLVTPPVHVATAAVFNDPQLTRDSPPLTIPSFPLFDSTRRAADLMLAGNNCEAAVCRRFPEIERCLGWLHGIGRARMTGTGSACFAIVGGDARAAVSECRWPAQVVRSLNRSPALSG